MNSYSKKNEALRAMLAMKRTFEFIDKTCGDSFEQKIDGRLQWTIYNELMETKVAKVRSRTSEIEPELEFFFERRKSTQRIVVRLESPHPVVTYEPIPIYYSYFFSFILFKFKILINFFYSDVLDRH